MVTWPCIFCVVLLYLYYMLAACCVKHALKLNNIIQEHVKSYKVQLTGHVSNGKVCDISLA